MNLNCATVLAILLVVKCSGQNNETLFPKDSQPGYKVFNKVDRNVMLTCDEGTSTSQLKIEKDDGRVLNRTTGHRLSYVIDRVTCEHSGTYICVVSTSNLNYSRTINVAVVGCPPRLYQDKESNKTLDVELYTNVSFSVCVLVPYPKTEIQLIISYKNQWFSKSALGTHGFCVSWYQDKSSIFLFTINITILNVSDKCGDGINLKIGTNYNYMNNYINYTRQIQLGANTSCTVQQNKTLDDESTSLKTETTTVYSTSNTLITSTKEIRNNTEAIVVLNYFLIFILLVMIILIFLFLSRLTKVRYFGKRVRLALMLIARRLLEMCTSSQEKESGTTEPTAEFNGIETNTAETNTTETTLERIDATDYYISEEGLVYLELGQTAPRPITRSRTIAEGSLNLTYGDSVEYVTLDFAETRDFEQYDDKEPLYTNQREAGVLRQL